MKEDILEQIVDDWLLANGSIFTKSNIKFRPDNLALGYAKKSDSNHSDIDILAVHLNKRGKNAVTVVTCKSWHNGFDPQDLVKCFTTIEGNTKRGGREAWRFFRELIIPKWSKAFVDKIEAETGQRSFTYIVAVTSVLKNRDRSVFENCSIFKKTLEDAGAKNFEIKIVTVSEILDSYFGKNTVNHTIASTQLGRLIQLMKASGIKINNH